LRLGLNLPFRWQVQEIGFLAFQDKTLKFGQ
jgi:hypothetical protein